MSLRARWKGFLPKRKKKSRLRDSDGGETGANTPQISGDNSSDAMMQIEEHKSTYSSSKDRRNEEEEEPRVDDVESDLPDKNQGNTLGAVDAAIDITLILREASEASSILKPLKICCSVIEKVLQAAREKLITDIDLLSLSNRLEGHLAFMGDEMHDVGLLGAKDKQNPPGEPFVNALKTYLKTLEAIRAEVASWNQQKRIARLRVSSIIVQGHISGLEAELVKAFNDFLREVHGEILTSAMKASGAAATLRLSHLFKGAVNARGERVKPITPGTRLSLIERLLTWSEANVGQDRIFWLHDEAGTGKSAVAAHLSREWETQGALAARFFFDQNGGRDLQRLERFCVTVAKEMSEHHPLAQSIYLDIIERITSPQDLPFSEAFQLLVVRVAERLSKRLRRPLVFVLDALDECHEEDIQLLISSILNSASSSGVRFLLTSRPTKEITSILYGISGVAGEGVVLLDVKNGEAQRDYDTSIYVRHTLRDFPPMDQNVVIECASGVFLWATLACETLLRAINPRKILDKFENHTPDQTMQILYETALETALPPEPSSHDLRLLHAVLQGVTLTYSPVSIFSVRTFFPAHKDKTVQGEEFVEFFVKKLGSIMKDGTPFLPIYILHPTFREFIEDQKNGAKFYISPPDGHQSIAIASLALLTEKLTPNVLGLDDGKSPLPVELGYEFEPPTRLRLVTEAPLRYAVAFWATHASLAIGEDDRLQRLVNDFLGSKLLVWIEWASAILELHECIEGVRRLLWAIKVLETSNVNNILETWCNESLRFLLRNNHIIERCGLQAWMSALVFTPKHSIIYKTFAQRSLRPLPHLLTCYTDASSPGSRVIWDQKSRVDKTIFSPDGKRLLGLSRNSASLWNAKSLKLITELGTDSVPCIINASAFSSDGSLIASGNDNSTLCLWDGCTGILKEQLPRRHRSFVLHVVFLLSDSVIASVDNHHRILCWSVTPTKTARTRARVMQGAMHTGQVAALVASPDRKLLATFSGDKTIRLWDPKSMMAVGQPMIADQVGKGSFSVDGTRIVAGYHNGVVGIWDVASQSRLHTLKSGAKNATIIAVSPDGRTIAAGDDYLSLWDIETGTRLCTPIEEDVTCLAFNKSGSRLISGSAEHQVTIWNTRSIGRDSIEKFALKGHIGYIKDVSSSPTGRLIASASEDGTLRVWDTDLLETSDADGLDRTHQEVSRLAVSKDGKRLVSVGVEGTFQMWDFVTGMKLGHLFHSPEGKVELLVFSSSSSLWCSSHSIHSGGVVCIWECTVDEISPTACTLLCTQGSITCIEFTRDQTYIVTGGTDQSIRCWNVSSRACVALFDCGAVPLHIALSHDGRYLVSASDDDNLRIWDVESQQLVNGPRSVKEREERKSGYRISSIVISADDTKIVAKRGYSLRIFVLRDALRCCAAFEDPFRSLDIPLEWSPTFSIDGNYLFYWSYTFNLSAISLQDGSQTTRLRPERTEGLPPGSISPLYINTARGAVHSTYRYRELLVIPADVKTAVWVAHDMTIAFGSSDGRVFIIRFPEQYL